MHRNTYVRFVGNTGKPIAEMRKGFPCSASAPTQAGISLLGTESKITGADIFTRLNYWVEYYGRDHAEPPDHQGVDTASEFYDLKTAYDEKNGAPTAATPKVFMKYFFVNTVTGEKSGEMLAVVSLDEDAGEQSVRGFPLRF